MSKGGELIDTVQDEKSGGTKLTVEIASSNMFGVRKVITDITGGNGIVTSEMLDPRPLDDNPNANKRTRERGVIVSSTTGPINAVDLSKLSDDKARKIFCVAADVNYEGMIIGEYINEKDNAISLTKKWDGRAGKAGMKDTKMGLEECLMYIQSDECLEVTPKRIQMRKVMLDTKQRELDARGVGHKGQKAKA